MDDFVINVRQVGNYQTLTYVGATDLLLVQQGGVGGPYANVTQDGLLAQVYQRLNVGILPPPFNKGIASSYLITPLGQRQGFNWYVDEDGVQRYLQNGAAGYWNYDGANLTWAILPAGEKDDQIDTSAWVPMFELNNDGTLTIAGIDITGPEVGPEGVATIGWVQANTVASFNSRIGAVTLALTDVTGAGGAPIASPTFTGTPSAPTPANPNQSDNQIATTSWVLAAISAHILATSVTSFNTRTGAVTLLLADVTGVGGAPIASPAFTGSPSAPTPTAGDSSTRLATTAFVATNFASNSALTGFAPLNSPVFIGVPAAPTPAPGTNTTQLATTAFVTAAVVASTTGVVSFNTRTGAVTLTAADVTAAGGATLASPAFTGNPTAPTPAVGDSDTSVATTAFVTAAIAAAGGVASFNGRTGVVSLVLTDVTNVGGAPLASPALTGIPTAPTAAAGTSTTQLATTAFIAAAIGAGSVTSFNSRKGVVTLSAADITNAGGALLAGPTFTGIPAAPTAAPGTSTTQLATTAFVQANVPAAVPSANVTASTVDFNNSITLNANDSGCIKNCTAGSPVTVTLPGSLPKTFYCTIVQAGAGQISFVPSGSASVHNRQGLTHSAGQYAMCALTVMSTTGANASYCLGGDCA